MNAEKIFLDRDTGSSVVKVLIFCFDLIESELSTIVNDSELQIKLMKVGTNFSPK